MQASSHSLQGLVTLAATQDLPELEQVLLRVLRPQGCDIPAGHEVTG